MSTENEMPKEAISPAPAEEQVKIEEGGNAAEAAVSTDEQQEPADGQPVAEQVEVEIVVPPEELDEEGFPIMPEEAYEYIEIAGMPREAAEQVVATSKETIKALKAQEEIDGGLDEKSRDLMKGAEDMLKMYWKTYKDIKANMPSKDEMLNHVSNVFDTEYFSHHSKLPGARKYGSFVGGLYGVTNAANTRMAETKDLLVVFNPQKYISSIKDYAYLIRKVYMINGANGQASKSVLDRAYFLPIMFVSAIVKYVENGADAVEVVGIRNILKQMDVREADGDSRLNRAYQNAKFCIDYFSKELTTSSVTGFKNFIGTFVEAAMNDNDINRKKVSDEKRSMWIQIMRGRINEFITTASQFVSSTYIDGLSKVENPEEITKITATSFLSMMVQNITMLPYYNDIWNFAGSIREVASMDKNAAGEECVRYYIGQISYWTWVLLNFTGVDDNDLNAFYEASKNTTNTDVFKAYESFKNLDHAAIRGKFFEVFEVSINNVKVLLEAIDESVRRAEEAASPNTVG